MVQQLEVQRETGKDIKEIKQLAQGFMSGRNNQSQTPIEKPLPNNRPSSRVQQTPAPMVGMSVGRTI